MLIGLVCLSLAVWVALYPTSVVVVWVAVENGPWPPSVADVIGLARYFLQSGLLWLLWPLLLPCLRPLWQLLKRFPLVVGLIGLVAGGLWWPMPFIVWGAHSAHNLQNPDWWGWFVFLLKAIGPVVGMAVAVTTLFWLVDWLLGRVIGWLGWLGRLGHRLTLLCRPVWQNRMIRSGLAWLVSGPAIVLYATLLVIGGLLSLQDSVVQFVLLLVNGYTAPTWADWITILPDVLTVLALVGAVGLGVWLAWWLVRWLWARVLCPVLDQYRAGIHDTLVAVQDATAIGLLLVFGPLNRLAGLVMYHSTQVFGPAFGPASGASRPWGLWQLLNDHLLNLLLGLILAVGLWSLRHPIRVGVGWLISGVVGYVAWTVRTLFRAWRSPQVSRWWLLGWVVVSGLVSVVLGILTLVVAVLLLCDRVTVSKLIVFNQSIQPVGDLFQYVLTDPVSGLVNLNVVSMGGVAVLVAVLVGAGLFVVLCATGPVNLGYRPTDETVGPVLQQTGLEPVKSWFSRYSGVFGGHNLEVITVVPALLLATATFLGTVGVVFYIHTYKANALNGLAAALYAYANTQALPPLAEALSGAVSVIGFDLVIALCFGFLVAVVVAIPLMGFWCECVRVWLANGFNAPLPQWNQRWGAYYSAGLHSAYFFIIGLVPALVLSLLTLGRGGLVFVVSWLRHVRQPSLNAMVADLGPSAGLVWQHAEATNRLLKDAAKALPMLGLGLLLTLPTLILPVILVVLAMPVVLMRLCQYHRELG
ncbi:MAG: hypothetical protein KC475_00855 [Cyanobacteria bacterium HKST-UBA03]|nr:hypothetical protein [Cyanobacteria bacterium HKST-UBA03]